jgi:hypothetical protein
MDPGRTELILTVAKTLAASGEHANWQSLQVRLIQLGFTNADMILECLKLRADLNAICEANYKQSSNGNA